MASKAMSIQLQLKINPEYQKLLPEMSKQHFETLKLDIKEKGQLFPITVTSQGVILDGHHRYRACQELGIKCIFVVKDFENELQEKLFVIDINLKRRHLNSFQRIELALKEKPILEEIAKRNSEANLKQNNHFNIKNNNRSNSDPHSPSVRIQTVGMGRVDQEIGRLAGVGKDTVRKVETILDKASPALIEKARLGQKTVNKVFKLTQREQRQKQTKEETRNYNEIQGQRQANNYELFNDDFRNVQLTPDSIDLIFTDPPYPESWLPNYADLAKLAANTLVPNGSLVTYCNHTQIPEIIEYMRNEGLVYWWMFAVFLQGPFKPYWSREVDQQYKLLLWFVKGKRERTGHNIFDRIDSLRAKKDLFEWEQHTAEPEYVISQLTRQDQKVLDPMMGEGTTGIAALALTRKFVGIDKHPERFKDTRARIAKFVSSGLDLKSELKPALNPIARGGK